MAAVDTVTSPRPPNRSGRVHRLLLVYGFESGQVGRSMIVDAVPVTIGRAVQVHGLSLDDPEVSRLHAEVSLSEGTASIKDCGSRNGTFVNAERVTGDRTLQGGDVIRVGANVLLYQALDEVDCRHLLDPVPTGTALIGGSPKIARVRHATHLASPGTLPVLISGETGVGKELVAHAIHAESGRSGAFVALNCGALPETLAESELFGHVGGAFTGAQHRQGLFARAREGTLFLDEIGEMEPSLQKRLLRALSTGEVRAVGSDQAQRVDVRVVSATNVDLDSAVERGTFRSDLYARLAGHVITVPPLRDRREDVLVILHHFLRARRLQAALTPDAAEALMIYRWPFNVRELEQVVGTLESTLRARRKLGIEELPDKISGALGGRKRKSTSPSIPSMSVLGIRRDAMPTKEELLLLLELHHGNVSQVAAFFGKGRRQVYRWVKDHGIDVGSTRAADRTKRDESD